MGPMIETVYDPIKQKGGFVILENGQISYQTEYKFNSITFHPLIDDAVVKGDICLPEKVAAPEKIDVLLSGIRNYIHKYVEVDSVCEEVATRYVALTWCFGRCEKLPYFRIMGPAGSGKSRLIAVMNLICYHSQIFSASTTPAVIYRFQDMYQGTLMIDEANFDNFSGKILEILRAGYDRNSHIPRCSKDDYMPNSFSPYGPKVLASYLPYSDEALESRFLNFTTTDMTRIDIPMSLDGARRDGIELRNRLLRFRISNYASIDTDYMPSEIQCLRPRVKEIILPIIQITGEKQIPGPLLEYFKALNQRQIDVITNSEEGLVVSALINAKKDGVTKIAMGEISKIIEGEANQSIHPRKIGDIVRSFGVSPKRTNIGNKIDLSRLNLTDLAKMYCIPQN